MPQITLPVFEGPLDLLLHLIERDDLDITAVSLVAVTDQYLRAVHDGESFDANALAEFVAIGAKLIYLKSRALLPVTPSAAGEEAAIEDDDVGRELVELLVEYRRFSAITDVLQERQEAGFRLFPRMAPPPSVPEGPGLDGVTVDAMRRIMLDVLNRIPPAERRRALLPRLRYTLSERVEQLRARLAEQGRLSFRELVAASQLRVEVVVSFLAVLELLKAGECDAVQEQPWGDILIVAA